jgi:hypothetical protein
VGRAADKLILLALAERHNPESGVAYPSVAWLAEFGSLDRKTVMASLDRLEAIGLISDSGQRFGKTLQVKAYSLHLGTVPKTEQSQKRNSPDFPEKQSQKRDTDTVLEPVGSEANASSPKARTPKRDQFPPPPGVSDQIWQDFLDSPNRKKAGMSSTAYSGVCNRLNELAEHGFPPGEMVALAVEQGWKTVKLEWVQNNERSQANRGNNGRMGGPRPDPTLELLRAARAAQRPSDRDHDQARLALPAR